jgi:hypothetical protein
MRIESVHLLIMAILICFRKTLIKFHTSNFLKNENGKGWNCPL